MAHRVVDEWRPTRDRGPWPSSSETTRLSETLATMSAPEAVGDRASRLHLDPIRRYLTAYEWLAQSPALRSANLGVSDKSPDDRAEDLILVFDTVVRKHQKSSLFTESSILGSALPVLPPRLPRLAADTSHSLHAVSELVSGSRRAPSRARPDLDSSCSQAGYMEVPAGESSRLDPAFVSCSPEKTRTSTLATITSSPPPQRLASIQPAICAVSRQLRSRYAIRQGIER
ncbi:hypothetical protein V8D89_005413 [Ganoderma adspersum]